MGGLMIFKDKAIYDSVFFNLMTNGGCIQAFEAFLLQRSVKTLKLRVE
jgi:cystathionine beta-lyase/cystathionine gamma-synthase